MKKVAVIGIALLVALSFLVVSGCDSRSNVASTSSGSVAKEEYLILNYRAVAHDDESLQTLLNDKAREGWKVRALDWNLYRIIMAR